MISFLEFRAWTDLRELAYAHGLTFHTRQTKAYGLERLRRQLLTEGRLHRAYKRLPEDAKKALDELRMHGGQMLLWQFHGRYGAIRIWRPWRAGIPRRPLHDAPSIAETLWHLGFIEIRRRRPGGAKPAGGVQVVMAQPIWHMLAPGAMRPRRRRIRRSPAPPAIASVGEQVTRVSTMSVPLATPLESLLLYLTGARPEKINERMPHWNLMKGA